MQEENALFIKFPMNSCWSSKMICGWPFRREIQQELDAGSINFNLIHDGMPISQLLSVYKLVKIIILNLTLTCTENDG